MSKEERAERAERVRRILAEHKVASVAWEAVALEAIVDLEADDMITVSEDGTITMTDKGRASLQGGS